MIPILMSQQIAVVYYFIKTSIKLYNIVIWNWRWSISLSINYPIWNRLVWFSYWYFSMSNCLLIFIQWNVQIFKPQIEKTRLEYIKHDDLILRIFERVEKQTLQKILTEDGTPDVAAINRWVKFQGTFLNRLKYVWISFFDSSSSISTCDTFWENLRKQLMTCSYVVFKLFP